MKRILSVLLLTFLMSMVGVQAYAWGYYAENADGVTIYYNYINDGKELEVTFNSREVYPSGYGGITIQYGFYSGSVVIPEEVNCYVNGNWKILKVTRIGNDAFIECPDLTSVTIPNSVTSIGYNAFSECTSLTSIEIPNSVTSIGYEAFSGCTSLTSIEIPNSVTSIGRNPFTDSGWYNAQPDGLLYLDNWLLGYKGNKPTGKIFIKNGTKGIAMGAFTDCVGLTSVTIPNTMASISNNAFSGCINLTSIEIPNSVTSIGGGAFQNCTSLTIVTIPSSVTSIGADAFKNCTSLTIVTIPSSVTSIGKGAFYGCDLTDIISYIENPKTVTSPFSSNTYRYATLYVPTGTINKYKATDSWKSIAHIKEFDNIADFTVDGIKYHKKSDGNLEVTGLNSSITTVNIPKIITQGAKYFVTSIGVRAFSQKSGLTSVEIPNSVKSLGDYAFAFSRALTTINIPNSVTSIGECAFADCTSLTSVHISDLESWCNIDFKGVYPDSNPLYCAKHLFLNGVEIKDLIIPNGVTSINNWAFIGGSSLTSITIPNSVTTIGKYAFYACSGFTSIEIPNSVTSIGTYAFSGCKGLTSVTIPNSVTSIKNNTFYGCSGLTSIIVSNENKYYDSRNNCNAIIETSSNTLIAGCVNTQIPNSVTSIGESAFRNCSYLTSIEIPNSVASIGDYAFYACSSLTSVTVEIETPLTITEYTFSNRANATLYVPKGSKAAYEAADYWKEFKEIVEIEPFVKGDANQDGAVNVTDIVATVNYIMENPTGDFNTKAADVNGDGFINVTDIVGMVNIIMSSGSRMDQQEVMAILKECGFIFKGDK